MKIRIAATLCLCLAGFMLSGILLGQHHGEPWASAAVRQHCGEGENGGCEEVAQSSWSTFRGIPLAALGVFFYISLLLLCLLALAAAPGLRDPLLGAAAGLFTLGLIADLWLLGVQAFAIRAYCVLCICTYVLSAAAFIMLFPTLKALKRLPAELARPEGRVAFAGWLLGTLLAAATAFGVDASFAARSQERLEGLLGTPADILADNWTQGAEVGGTAYWKKRAERLQWILDDPRRVEDYWSEKALREFDAAPEAAIALEHIPVKGTANAPIAVVSFSDFLCAYCRDLARALAAFVPQSEGRVRLYFKNFPLDKKCNPALKRSTHPGACNLALGGICAERQGKFFAYHDQVLATNLDNPQIPDVLRLGHAAGLNADSFRGCMDDPGARAALDAEIAEANRLGVRATPTVFINGKELARINDFVQAVNQEARKRGFAPIN